MRGTIRHLTCWFMMLFTLLLAVSADAYNFESVKIRALGESSSTGTYDAVNQYCIADTTGEYVPQAGQICPFTGVLWTTDQINNWVPPAQRCIPTLLASYLTTASGVPVTAYNYALGGTGIIYPIETSTSPAKPTQLANCDSRIVTIMYSGNDAIRIATDICTGSSVYCGTVLTLANWQTYAKPVFKSRFKEVLLNVRRSGKVPVVMAGYQLQNVGIPCFSTVNTVYTALMNTMVEACGEFDTAVFYDYQTRMASVLRTSAPVPPQPTDATRVILSTLDGVHAWPDGHQKVAYRTRTALYPHIDIIKKCEMAARWYALARNVAIDYSSMLNIYNQLATYSVDQVAENVYIASGLNDLQWCTALVNNANASGLVSAANLVTIMNTNSTLKHGKIMNWFIDQVNASGSSTPIATMRNKTSVGFANGYVYQKASMISLSSVTATASTVASATASMGQ